jgi:hypothetical protein
MTIFSSPVNEWNHRPRMNVTRPSGGADLARLCSVSDGIVLARVRAPERRRDPGHAAGRQEDRVVVAVQVGNRDGVVAVADADSAAQLDPEAERIAIAYLDREHLTRQLELVDAVVGLTTQ